jgi:hypothetical protein
LLRDVIIKASNQIISKRRSCENSKVWWTDELTQLKKNLAQAKRMYKALQTKENLSIFKKNRNDYFQTIRFAKKNFWQNFLNNAIEKEVFKHTNSLKTIEWKNFINLIRKQNEYWIQRQMQRVYWSNVFEFVEHKKYERRNWNSIKSKFKLV